MTARVRPTHYVLIAGAAFVVYLAFVAHRRSGSQAPGIEIRGTPRFESAVWQALELLQAKSPATFRMAADHIGVIEQGEHSGMWARRTPPTLELGDPTTFYSVTWCAGSIAHDAFHSKLYHDYRREHAEAVPDEVWIGQAAEKQCIAHQLRVLEEIDAPPHEIEYCRQLRGDHHDVNNDGKYDWDDYRTRDW